MESDDKLCNFLKHCLLPKLARNLDETDNHPEFDIRQNYLNQHFGVFLDLLRDLDFRKQADAIPILSQIMILNLELRSEGPWNTKKCEEYSQQLNCTFDMIYGTSLDDLLQSHIFSAQEVFDQCVKSLHQKITSDNYRYYPSLIEVYCTLVQNIKDYKIEMNPLATLPISLLLIDDCMKINKMKGLKCCGALLQCLEPDAFIQGNYYEVIYESLKKVVTDKDIEVTKLVLDNFSQLLRILPIHAKKTKLDKMFAVILEQLYIESNLYRKVECFKFIKIILQIHGINCINRRIFKEVMCENIDICTNDAVANILMTDILECLEVWIQHCWCIWRLSSDHKLLSNLFKILYVCKEKHVVLKIYNIILTLISLCTKEEQKKIHRSLEMPLHLPNKEFLKIIEEIKREINT